MRLPVPVLLAALSASPVLAQAPSVYEQYEDARAVYLGDFDAGEYNTQMPGRLLDGLDGDWFAISALAPSAGEQDLFDDVCYTAPNSFAVTSRFGFSVEQFYGGVRFVTAYTARGGNLFATQTDPEDEFRRLGVKPTAVDDTLVARTLQVLNGQAMITRPSPDILVIQPIGLMPQIYARCAD